MAEQPRPGPAEENNERITARSHDEGFATFPDHEVDDIRTPGAGPAGTLDDGPRLPLLVVGVGALVAFSAFFFDSGWPLGIGLVIVLAGAIWAGVGGDHPGHAGGLGPVDES